MTFSKKNKKRSSGKTWDSPGRSKYLEEDE